MQAENQIPLPKLDEFLNVIDESLAEDARQRQFTAALVAIAGLMMGLIGNVLFYATPIGINVYLYVVLGALVAFGLLIYFRRPIVRKHAVFIFPAALFALLLAVRLAPELVFFNTAALLGSLLIVVHFTGTARFLGGDWLQPLQRAFETMVIDWIDSLRAVVPDSLRWIMRTELDDHLIATLRSLLRGLLITAPVVAIFALLLSSADAVFGHVAGQVVTFFLPHSVPGLFEQGVMIAVFSVMALTAFWTMLGKTPIVWSDTSPRAKTRPFRLNIIEASMLLGSVNVLFIAFVVIQARYFFGGQANITAQGYTYAAYARRGFYELLAVSCMTMALLVTLEALTSRKREEENVFRGLVALMVGLTLVILVAAFQRLSLYEHAYGYTRIRVMSSTFMIWLALLLGALLVAILWHRRVWFWAGCVIAGLGFVLTLNVMNMDGFIAAHNITRFAESGKLDVSYLLTLSDDALPTIASLVDNPDLDVAEREHLLRGLAMRLVALDRDQETRGLFGYHLGRRRAWKALNAYRYALRPYYLSGAR